MKLTHLKVENHLPRAVVLKVRSGAPQGRVGVPGSLSGVCKVITINIFIVVLRCYLPFSLSWLCTDGEKTVKGKFVVLYSN